MTNRPLLKQTKISSYCPFPFPPYSNLITNECLHSVNGKSGDASHKIKWDMRCFINNRMIFRWGFQEIKREKGWVFTFKVVYLSFIYVFNIFLAKGKTSTSNHRLLAYRIICPWSYVKLCTEFNKWLHCILDFILTKDDQKLNKGSYKVNFSHLLFKWLSIFRNISWAKKYSRRVRVSWRVSQS
jgi:hypothetical protein